MHEVAVTAASASVLLVLPAGGFPEVRYGRELNHDRPPRVEAPCQALQRAGSCILIPAEATKTNHSRTLIKEFVPQARLRHDISKGVQKQ